MRSDEVLIPPARVQIAAILARADEAECSVIRDIADVSDAFLDLCPTAIIQLTTPFRPLRSFAKDDGHDLKITYRTKTR